MSRHYFFRVFLWAFSAKKRTGRKDEGNGIIALMHKPVKPGRKGGCRGIQGDRKLGVAGYDVGHLGEAQSKLKSFPHP